MNTVTVDTRDAAGAVIQAFRAEIRDPARPLSLLARFTVQREHEPKVEAAFSVARSPTLKEPGCLAFNLNRDPRNPGQFVVYEQWRTFADFEAHFRTDYVTHLRAELNELLVGEPKFEVLLPSG